MNVGVSVAGVNVGVYVDGLNLYYGGRSLCGRNQPGWRWLDIRLLASRLLARRHDWESRGAVIARMVYCTSFIDGRINREGRLRQDAYIRALREHGSFDHLEKGRFMARVRSGLLATRGPHGRPIVTSAHWPIVVRDSHSGHVPDAQFMVSYLNVEEKGSDVNVASHLLVDVLERTIDAAIVISNDSDLRFPIQFCRRRVPIGTVNPGAAHLAGDLRGGPNDGVGGHWWYRLAPDDFRSCQLPDSVGEATRPVGW